MRRWLLAGVALLCVGGGASPAQASVINSWGCSFAPGSDALDADCLEGLRLLVRGRDFIESQRQQSRGANADPSPTTGFEVSGYIDTAEATRGWTRVGEQRARAVAEALIAMGVPRDMVMTRNEGAEVTIPTGPNVWERQNRRATVVVVSRRAVARPN
jgi:hypothetical protein